MIWWTWFSWTAGEMLTVFFQSCTACTACSRTTSLLPSQVITRPPIPSRQGPHWHHRDILSFWKFCGLKTDAWNVLIETWNALRFSCHLRKGPHGTYLITYTGLRAGFNSLTVKAQPSSAKWLAFLYHREFQKVVTHLVYICTCIRTHVYKYIYIYVYM